MMDIITNRQGATTSSTQSTAGITPAVRGPNREKKKEKKNRMSAASPGPV